MELTIVRKYSDGNEKDRAHVRAAFAHVFARIDFEALAAKNCDPAPPEAPSRRESRKATKPGSHKEASR